MKFLLGFSALATSLLALTSVAQANCTSHIYSKNNNILGTYVGFDCANAMNKCQEDLRWRHTRNQAMRARCEIDPNSNRPDPRRPDPRRPDPRYGAWQCAAFDAGYEEHSGGHVARAYNRGESERAAMSMCLRAHGRCYISSCTQQ